MKLTSIMLYVIMAFLPLLVHGGHVRSNRWGCSSNPDCIQVCRRTCANFLRPLCFGSQCYCQVMGLPRLDYRASMDVREPEMYDYEVKHISH